SLYYSTTYVSIRYSSSSFLLTLSLSSFLSFFFNDPPTTEIYTLSLHDALPIYPEGAWPHLRGHSRRSIGGGAQSHAHASDAQPRSEEHTSELQSRSDLVCRLLLEKKKKKKKKNEIKKKKHEQYE